MILVLGDTSGLIAALDTSHCDHHGANEALTRAGLVVIAPLVLAELDHIATREFGRQAALEAIDDIHQWMQQGRAIVPEITEDQLGTAQVLRRRYSALDLDLTDTIVVALAARYETNAILTVDRRDFRALRPLSQHKAFRLLPDDLLE